jgi:1-acyl-sn-glycerol-3-phosphate acyltransferase
MLRLLAEALRILYGICALAAFFLLLLIAAVLALAVPRLAWRRSLTRWVARIALLVLGLRVSVRGLRHLPEGSSIIAANHASYLDGVVLMAMLPPRFTFLIKREAADMPVLGLLLWRIGAEFVDRHSSGGRQRDARRVIRRAAAGHSLVFFPEGTFDGKAGLARFHIGAFAVAVRGGVPVVPTIIHGARRALPSGAAITRPGRILVEILEPLPVVGTDATPESLRDETRRRILARLDEPDLAPAGHTR